MDFLRRHKTKLLLLGGAAGAVIAINKVLSSYEKQWQTSSSRGFVHEARKKEIHFENILNECNQLCHKLAPTLVSKLQAQLDDSNLIQQLREKGITVSTKTELWKTLKVKIMTRLISEIYSTCIMVCTTRVQMSVIGGFIFAKNNTDNSRGSSSAGVAELTHLHVYQKYIELLTKVQTQRVDSLIQPVEEAVDEAMKDYALDYEVSIQDFKTILEKIRQSIAFLLTGEEFRRKILFNTDMLTSDMTTTSNGIIFSKEEQETLESMLNETQDIIEGRDFKKVLDSGIEVGYAVLLDSLLDTFMRMDPAQSTSSQDDGTDFSNPNTFKVCLAKILPQIKKTSINKSESEQKALVNHMLCLDVLNCFAANVYEAFCMPAQA